MYLILIPTYEGDFKKLQKCVYLDICPVIYASRQAVCCGRKLWIKIPRNIKSQSAIIALYLQADYGNQFNVLLELFQVIIPQI